MEILIRFRERRYQYGAAWFSYRVQSYGRSSSVTPAPG